MQILEEGFPGRAQADCDGSSLTLLLPLFGQQLLFSIPDTILTLLFRFCVPPVCVAFVPRIFRRPSVLRAGLKLDRLTCDVATS
jgi:hypothetical protein